MSFGIINDKILYHQPNFKMKSKPTTIKFLKPILTAIAVLLVFVNSTVGQLNSNLSISNELKTLDKLIKDIRWDNNSKYLLYHNMGFITSEPDEVQNMEVWMVDLDCWNSDASSELNEVFCTEQLEFDYKVEDWMLESYKSDSSIDTLIDKENEYHVESWMYDLQKF